MAILMNERSDLNVKKERSKQIIADNEIADPIAEERKVSRDTIDTDLSNLVEIKQQFKEKIQQINLLKESEVTPSGNPQAGAADTDQDELNPNRSFENIIPVICNKVKLKCEVDNDMDFPHDNDIFVVLPRQQLVEGQIELPGQLTQTEETQANKKKLSRITI
ncbi:hypothetical protein CHS0354_036757 [Potamilus streckersoni]|uniref:Uncharacterized protein n=1 Tax=Potamilus streckersoni TaxID=2493646 RepID=A0AAE0VQR9_9BIVA|nr:hypothetical protein CHS0354_036757 [Potamilus streckersoni]